MLLKLRAKLTTTEKYSINEVWKLGVLWDIDVSAHLRKFTILIFSCTNAIFHFKGCNVFDFKPFLYYKLTQKAQNSILQSIIQVEKIAIS